jgi:Fe-S oxidoreductase
MNQDPVALFGAAGVWILRMLTLAALAVFSWRVYQLVGLLRQGEAESRFDRLGRRLRHFLANVLLQPRIFKERSIGLPHFLIFWGFVVYATCFWWALLRGVLPLPIPYPDDVKPAAFFLDVSAVLVCVSLAIAVARRWFYPPPHLHLSLDANLILSLIAILMLSNLFGTGFKVAAGGERSLWTPFGGLVSLVFAGMDKGTALDLSKAMWWLHMGVVLGFLVYLPYSKHLHLLASPFNVFFSNAPVRPLGDLSISGAGDELAAGASKWNELTWKQLLSGFSCAECGRCDRSCPAATAGFPLEPQQIVQKIKRHVIETGLKSARGNGDGNGGPQLIGEVISENEIWACTTCMACTNCCAVWNEQVPLILQLRRHLVGQGRVDRTVQNMLANLSRYGNSFGKSDRLRARWVQSTGLKIKDARREAVDYLWFVGDYASYDTRVEDITKKTARVLAQAGLSFGLLYEGERNAGNDARRVGEEGLFDMLREKNLQTMAKAQYQAIVTTDPHTYNTLKNEYRWNGNAVPVRHYTEVLDELLQQNKLPLKQKLSGRVTYHDPCYLGRYNGVYDPPRRVLRGLGLEVVEMPRNRDRSYCFGAGGGRIWMEDTPGIKERPAENRIREAASVPGVSTLVVACPKDIAMFRDAIKTTGNEGKITVKDISELVSEAMEERAEVKS